jgi:hypothetical protein
MGARPGERRPSDVNFIVKPRAVQGGALTST